MALGALLLQEVLDALAAFVIQDMELWLVPKAMLSSSRDLIGIIKIALRVYTYAIKI